MIGVFFFFKQKTAYEIPKRDRSSDVCSSDLCASVALRAHSHPAPGESEKMFVDGPVRVMAGHAGDLVSVLHLRKLQRMPAHGMVYLLVLVAARAERIDFFLHDMVLVAAVRRM